MSASRLRAIQPFSRQLAFSRRAFSISARQSESKASHPKPEPQTKAPAVTADATPQVAPGAVQKEVLQAPNRAGIWSRSQRPRSEAMTGPRFEQTDFDLQVGEPHAFHDVTSSRELHWEHRTNKRNVQPQPYAAIELVHKQPVRWTHDRVVACDGGGGPTGHPKIYINTDKPEIAVCGYCGAPFVCHYQKHLGITPKLTVDRLTNIAGSTSNLSRPPHTLCNPRLVGRRWRQNGAQLHDLPVYEASCVHIIGLDVMSRVTEEFASFVSVIFELRTNQHWHVVLYKSLIQALPGNVSSC